VRARAPTTLFSPRHEAGAKIPRTRKSLGDYLEKRERSPHVFGITRAKERHHLP
jgi:hypothetical protein